MKQRKFKIYLHSSRRGVALLEFALIIVLLLLLTLGLVQFAIISNQSMALAQVTREGARYAALNSSSGDDDTVKQYIQDTARNYNKLEIADEDIVITRGTGTGDRVEVEITYDMKNVLFLPNQFQVYGMEHPIVFVPSLKKEKASYMMEGR